MADPPKPVDFESYERFEMAISTFLSRFKSAADKEIGRASIYRSLFDSSNRLAENADAEVKTRLTTLRSSLTTLEEERDMASERMAHDVVTIRTLEASLEDADLKAAQDGAAITKLQSELKEAIESNPSAELLQMRDERIGHLTAMLADYKEIVATLKAAPAAAPGPSVELDIPDAALYQMIQPFDGSASGIGDFEAWMGQFTLQVQHLSDRAKLKYLVLSAKGDAQKTILNLDKETSGDYAKLVEVLKERYPPLHTTKQYHNMLRVASQNSTESVNEFANRLRQLVDKAKPELKKYLRLQADIDFFTKQRFVDGIRRAIVEILLIHNTADDVDEFPLQKTIDECRKVEQFIKSGHHSGSFTNYKSPLCEQPASQVEQRKMRPGYNSSFNQSSAPSNTGGLNNSGLPNPLAKTAQPFANQNSHNAAAWSNQRNANMQLPARQPQQQSQVQPRQQQHSQMQQQTQQPAQMQPRQQQQQLNGARLPQSQTTRPQQSQGNGGNYGQSNRSGNDPRNRPTFMADVQRESPPTQGKNAKARSRKKTRGGPSISESDQELIAADGCLDAEKYECNSECNSDGSPSYMAASPWPLPKQRCAIAPVAATRVMIEGVRVVNTLLDTGSSVNAISLKFFDELCDMLGIDEPKRACFFTAPPVKELIVVGGGIENVTHGVALKVKFPFGEEKVIDFCMLPSCSPRILLGVAALRALGVRLTTPQRPDVNLITHVSSDAAPRTPMVASQKVTVSSNSTRPIPAKPRPPGRQLCGSDPHAVQCYGLVRSFDPIPAYPNLTICPKILPDSCDGESCVIEVTNKCSHTVVIEKGDTVGYGSQTSPHEFDSNLEQAPFAADESLTEIPPSSNLAQDRSNFIIENLKAFGAQLNAEQADILLNLTKPKCAFKWSTEGQNAFDKLKSILREDIVLRHPDPGRPFELYTDACDIGICPSDSAADDRPAPIVEMGSEADESSAVAKSLLEDMPLNLPAERVVEISNTIPSPESKTEQQASTLEELDAAQSLDSCCQAVDMPQLVNDGLLEHESVTAAQLKCEECRELKNTLAVDAARHPTLAVSGDTLLSIDQLGRGTYVPFVPVAMREAVVLQAHSSPVSGHLHKPKLYDMLAKRCAWPTMRVDIHKLVADRHPSHMSDLFFQTVEAMGIRTNFSRGYTHHHAGQVERFNRSLLQMLRRSAASEHDWTLALPWVLLEYRESVCAATGYSPAFLTYGRNLRLPIDKILAHKPTGVVDEPSRIQQIALVLDSALKNVRHTNEETRSHMIDTYRKVHGTKPPDIAVGMLVHVMEARELLNRPNRKLYKPRYTGPFEVTKVDLPLIEIRGLDGKNTRMVHLRDVVKAKHLITPHYGTRRAPRVPQKAEPPSADRAGGERYNLRKL